MSRNAPFRGRQRRRVAKIRFGHSRVPNKRKIVIKPSMMRTLGSKY